MHHDAGVCCLCKCVCVWQLGKRDESVTGEQSDACRPRKKTEKTSAVRVTEEAGGTAAEARCRCVGELAI